MGLDFCAVCAPGVSKLAEVRCSWHTFQVWEKLGLVSVTGGLWIHKLDQIGAGIAKTNPIKNSSMGRQCSSVLIFHQVRKLIFLHDLKAFIHSG